MAPGDDPKKSEHAAAQERPALGSAGAARAAFLEQVVRNLPDFVVLVDRELSMEWVNRVAPGLNEAQVLGASLLQFMNPETHQAARDAIESVFQTGRQAFFEGEGYGDGGATAWYATRVLPTDFETKQLVLVMTSLITERKQAELALRESERRFRALAEHSPDFIGVINEHRKLEYLNRPLPGAAEDALRDKPLEVFADPTGPADAVAAIDDVFRTGRPAEYEARAPGTQNLLRMRVVQLESAVGRQRALLVGTDITAERRAEQAREYLQSQLHQAQRLECIGLLAGGIAHDFNNLLQVIQSNLHFARDSLEHGDDPREELAQAELATDRASELTQHLLTIGRRQRVNPQRVELGQLVARSVRMLRRTIPENIRIDYTAPPEDCVVSVDPPQFEQVLLNLCVNARDAMPDGGTLEIHVAADPAGDQQALLTVSDTGVGITEEDLERVFEPFYSTKGSGSGLGLAIVAGIVSAHGGTTSVESKLGSGTTFRVRVPLVDTGDVPESSPTQQRITGRKTVLVAEDDPLVRAQAARVLREGGYRVLEAEDGQHAVDLFKANVGDIDLVLLDVMMPRLDGWQAFSEINRHKQGVKVLFTSGYAASTLPADFDTHDKRLLSKPYKPHMLLTAVRETLDS